MSFLGTRHLAARAFALLLCATQIAAGCRAGRSPIAPVAGAFAYQEPLRLAFRDGELNLAGGAWATRRVDFSLDTRIGTYELGAVHDSLSATWRWSHELFFDGNRFVDASGAEHAAQGLAPGERKCHSDDHKVDWRGAPA